MDLAVHPDGSVYVATRKEILRLRDPAGTGRATEVTPIIRLETAGSYPHNGLSGLAFDARGDLTFGMGENLGAAYKLIGADGVTITGGGEGGGVYWCSAGGRGLRRVATGFWNPFGAGRDIFGRLFVVDNDPDASPPCRLLHVVEGGDYGYQFRYGRSGRHPFQSWNGEVFGTLPMAAGTGESPCEVTAYESDGLPPEYRGQLLVPAWADHRVERYAVRPNGASVAADRLPFARGGDEFRPSGLAVAPDGSVYVSDWVSRSYELHGKGAIWRVRWKDAKPGPRPTDPKLALASLHRPTREAAARALARDEAGAAVLRANRTAADLQVRAAAWAALLAVGDATADRVAIARSEPDPGLRAMVVRSLARNEAAAFDSDGSTEVRAAAIRSLEGFPGVARLFVLLTDPDPFLRNASVVRLADLLRPESPISPRVDVGKISDPKMRAGVLLAFRAIPREAGVLPELLADPDPDVRFLAVKWVADERLTAYRPQIAAALANPALAPREVTALATALARIDDQPVNETSLAKYFLDRVADPSAPAAVRVQALRAVPTNQAALKTEMLIGLLAAPDPALRVETLRALKDKGDAKAKAAVAAVARDDGQPDAVRTQAVLTLTALDGADLDLFVGLATGPNPSVRMEALRSLTGGTLDDARKAKLDGSDTDEEMARVLGRPFRGPRPAAADTDEWLKFLDGPADTDAGRRVFEHPRSAGCYRCHRVAGRGADVGPDLSLIGRTDRKWIVESILRPSAVVAPHYQGWTVETLDGRTFIGLLVGTKLDESEYVGPTGERVKVPARDVAGAVPARTSVMPDALLDPLTDREVRDLIAYLSSLK